MTALARLRGWAVTVSRWSGRERLAFVAALGLNPWMRRTLRRHGTRAALDTVRRWSGGSARSDAAPDSEVVRRARRLGAVVNRAAAPPAPTVTCLARSLTLQLLLQRQGIPGELRIGVRPSGPDDEEGPGTLLFHAWIEVAGTPVNDGADVGERYATFPLDQVGASVRFD